MKEIPHHMEAEQSVLGAILLDGDCLLDVREILSGEEFYRAAHRTIFTAMMVLWERNEPSDPVTLTNLLKSQNKLDEAGGATYLASLLDYTPSAVNVVHYAQIVREKALRRRILSIAHQLAEKALDQDRPVEEVVAQGCGDLASIDHHRGGGDVRDMRTLTSDAIKRIEARANHPNYVSGVSTGFKKLDQMTNGLQPSDLVIIAGRTSMGKSAFGQQLAKHAAREAGPAIILSLEMSADSLIDRFLSSCARIPSQRIRSGVFQKGDRSELLDAAKTLADLPLVLIDKPGLTAQEIRFMARQEAHRRGNLALIVIDYLGLVRPNRREHARYLEVGETTKTFKELARELKVPVVALSQLNRRVDERQDKRPHLSDLRESGDIEQDADLVAFIHRPEAYCSTCSHGRKKDCAKGHQGLAEIIVAKHRTGPTGVITLTWLQEFTRFEDRAHE